MGNLTNKGKVPLLKRPMTPTGYKDSDGDEKENLGLEGEVQDDEDR